MPMWRLFYHVVFATWERQPVLTVPLREMARQMLRHKADELDCVVHAIHVQPEHAHLALSIPPARSIASVVGQLKGYAGHDLSPLLPPRNGHIWQESYSVFSFSERSLPVVLGYIHDQERRHAVNDLLPAFERTVDDAIENTTLPRVP